MALTWEKLKELFKKQPEIKIEVPTIFESPPGEIVFNRYWAGDDDENQGTIEAGPGYFMFVLETGKPYVPGVGERRGFILRKGLPAENALQYFYRKDGASVSTYRTIYHNENLAIKYGYIYNIAVPANSYVDVTVPFNYTFAKAPMLVAWCGGGNTDYLFVARQNSVGRQEASVRINTNITWSGAIHLYWLAIDVA